jgi:uncharacterized membrane protein
MPPVLHEWLDLIVRWAHVVAAIMWIGDSFLFMWLDASLSRAEGRKGDVAGELWMTHSGGFYEVVKHRSLGALPARLYWFMWQSYSTWITGVLLIAVVFGLGGRAMLVDVGSTLSHGVALGMVFGTLIAGVLAYELLCRVRGPGGDLALGAVGLAAVAALAWWLTHALTARAGFLVVGATLGTIMTANVFHVIIPAQRAMVAATRGGAPVDTSHGVRAKRRSVHNHYLTFPVLFCMLSNHVPGLYGAPHAWAVLALVAVAGACAKDVMQRGRGAHALVWAAALACLAGAVALSLPASGRAGAGDHGALAAHPRVDDAEALAIVARRCASCHAAKPTNPAFAAAPNGVELETLDALRARADRILVRVYETETMPLGNLTGMTPEERTALGAWARQQRSR